MIRARFTWALALVLCAGLWACGKSTGGGNDNPGGSGGSGGTGGDAVCGNSAVEAGEECDDGNVVAGDGCDANCQEETVIPGACDDKVDYRGNASLSNGLRTLVWSIDKDKDSMLAGSCGGDGQEVVFSFIADKKGVLYFVVANPEFTNYADGLAAYAMTGCDTSTELACVPPATDWGMITIDQPGEVLIVVDALETLDADLEFNLGTQFIALKEEGESCDPEGVENMCAQGLVCKGNPSTCQPGTAPVIDRGAMYLGGDPSYVIASGTDEEGDVVAFKIEPIGADGQPMTIIDMDGDGTPDSSLVSLDAAALYNASFGSMGFFPNADGTWFSVVPTYWSALQLALWDPAEEVAEIRLTLTDSAGLDSNALTFGPPVAAGLGDACDNDGFVVCGEGLVCKGDPSVCAQGTAPVITRSLYGPRPDGVVALVFEGNDVDDDLDHVTFEMLDANGAVIPFDYDGDGNDDPSMPIAMTTNGDTTFFASFTVPEELASPQIALTPVDAIGLEGPRVVIASTPVPVRAEGEGCSTVGWDACVGGLFCIGDTPVCTDLRGDLCEAAPVIEVAAPGPFSAEGEVTMPSLWEPPAGCGGDFGEPAGTPEGIVVLRLANAATTVTISTNNDLSKNGGMADGDTMVYVLPTACGAGEALGCNDDTDFNGQNFTSTLVLNNVPAGEYTIVVDTWYAESEGGAFQVDVTVQ